MAQLPSFLKPLATHSAPATKNLLVGTAGAGHLAFSMQTQTETQWCWAAVSTSVSHFYTPASVWTQCRVANRAWSRTDCCGSGASGPCNTWWYLQKALRIVSVFRSWKASIEKFAVVQAEIKNGNPLCLRVGWFNGGGHFLAIYGWQETNTGNQYYNVDDPIFGRQLIAKRQLEINYQSSGRWTHSYFVTPPTSGIAAVDDFAIDFPSAKGA